LKTILHDSILQWHKSIWNNGHSFWSKFLHDKTISSLTSGAIAPLIFGGVSVDISKSTVCSFPPFITGQAAIILSMTKIMDSVPLYSLSSKLNQQKALQAELSIEKISVNDVLDLDTNILKHLIFEYLQGYGTNDDDLSTFLNQDCTAIADRISNIPESYVSPEVRKKLNYIAQLLPTFEDSDVQTRGLLWVSFAMVFLHSYIPDFPVDPVETRKAKLQFLSKVYDEETSKILVDCESEYFVKGHFDNSESYQKEVDKIAEMSKKEKKLNSKLPLRPEISQIKEVHAELQNLKNDVLGADMVDELTMSLMSSNRSKMEFAVQKESSVQEVLSSIVTRWDVKFPYYRDLLQPLKTAVFQLKYGLRLILSKGGLSSKSHFDSITSKLLKFTDVFNLGEIKHLLTQVDAVSRVSSKDKVVYLNIRLSILESIVVFKSTQSSTSKELLNFSVELLHSIADDWSDAEELRLQKIEEEASLYRVRKEVIMTEEEEEELELKNLFPDYDEDFKDLEDEEDNREEAVFKNLPAKEVSYDGKKANDIAVLFSRLCEPYSAEKSFDSIWARNYQRNFSSAVDFVAAEKHIPSSFVDEVGRSGFLYMSRHRINSIEKPVELGTKEVYDFYTDPNIYEARKIFPVILKYETTLKKALIEWPEHTVLLKLQEICRRIISFPSTSPVMKLLMGLELLLLKSEDWQKYTSKEYSLKVELDEIVKLIVNWRKLELETWKELLEIESRKCSQLVSMEWFALWKLVNGALSEVDEEIDVETQNIVLQRLNDYCLDSSIGEFKAKLQLLNTLRVFVSHYTTVQGKSSDNFIQKLLWNVCCYYDQFIPSVDKMIETLRTPIQKELKGYVQIATWKDVNVYALKESAKKTHYHLNKFVKKFRLGLQTRLSDIIASYRESPPSVSKSTANLEALIDRLGGNLNNFISKANLNNVNTQFENGDQTKKVAKLCHLFDRSKKLGEALVADNFDITNVSGLEELGSELLCQIDEFKNMNSEIQGGTKKAKGQKVFRKKAWVDFLKLLSFTGLNSKCSQKYVIQQDRVFMNTQPEMDFSKVIKVLSRHITFNPLINDITSKAETYHFRNIARIDATRKLKSTRSLDISLLELEKSMSFLDHLMHFSLEQRTALSFFTPALLGIDFINNNLLNFANSQSIYFDATDMLSELIFWQNSLPLLLMSCQKTKVVLDCVIGTSQDSIMLKRNLSKYECDISVIIKKVDLFLGASHLESQEVLKTAEVKTILESCEKNLRSIHMELSDLSNSVETMKFIYKDFYNLSQSLITSLGNVRLQILNTVDRVDYEASIDLCLEKALVSIQNLGKPEVKTEGLEVAENFENTFGIDKGGLMITHLRLVSPLASRALGELSTEVNRLLGSLSGLTNLDHADQIIVQNQLRALFSLLDQLSLMLSYRIYELLLFHKTVTKFCYILSNTFYSIIKNGFCVPVEEEQEEGPTEDNVGGMGIGEGDGKKDVSDEIEDQEEVEGLQNDQKSGDPPKELDEEDNGIEMSNDFDGALEEVDEKEREEGQEEDDDEEKEDQDEQMGQVDQDLADTVDEKMWGDEDESSKDGKDEKTERDNEVENQGGETETAAKENDDKPKENEKDSQKNEKKDHDEAASGGDDDEGPINEDDNYEDNQGVDVKQADDAKMDDDENEMDDLPDKMELDGSENGNDDHHDKDLDDDAGNDSDGKDQEMPKMPDDENNNDMEDDNALPEVEPEDMNGSEVENQEEIEVEGDKLEGEDGNKNEGSDTPEDEEDNINTTANGLGEENPGPEADDEDENEQEKDNTGNKNGQNERNDMSMDAFGIEGATGVQSKKDEQAEDEGAGEEGNLDQDETNQVQNENGDEKSNQQPRQGESSTKNDADTSSQSNPHRSVGNAMEKWMSRLRNISDGVEEDGDKPKEKNETMDGAEGNEFEFVQEDDKDQGDTQALGVAEKDQLEKMDKQALGEQEGEEMMDLGESMNVDEPDQEPPLREENEIESSKEMKGMKGSVNLKAEDEEASENGEMNREMSKTSTDGEIEHEDSSEMVSSAFEKKMHIDEEELVDFEMDDTVDIQDYDTFRLNLEKRMANWRQEGRDPQEAQDLWRKYSALTRDLSFHLCEQLRLILEPTLSTKLKGDYRTGKRLNMRKIISYIASQFKKDKIWLRRTKPSKRTYQIMIAIDDSLSMASSHSVQLAFESLTVITTALNQLEAGEISVVSFGEDVKLIHPFEKKWSDEAGAEALGCFSFAQERTRVRLLMDQSLEVLRHARMNQRTPDLWQLELILSDGICEDHEYIKNRVHAAAEEQIAMVFVVLDTKSEKDSILNMTNVSYDTDPVTNLPKLKMERYMDTFPFDYYVIVKNVEDLPAILADTLRQFFMFASGV
jgi:midasin